MAALLSVLRVALIVAAPLLTMFVMRQTLERLWPAGPRRERRHGVNVAAWAALFVGQLVMTPALGGFATVAINASGGGWIALPTRGWGWWAGLVVYVLAMDLGEYLFHRAQHAIPAMWAMHSLHHSDRHFDSATTTRHFWLEPGIKMVTIWLAVGVLFKTPPSVAGVYVLAGYWHYVVHSNTRLDFGRWSWLLNGPGYHRLHHSDAEEHFDVNFASLFPLFDVLSGAYRPPRPGERVQTGLDTGEEPQRLLEVVAWPARGLLTRGAARRSLASA